MTTRYWVRVRPDEGAPAPQHNVIQDVRPDHEGYYNFPFITKRPAYPNAPIPGVCRYVEDFQEMYGTENVEARELGPLNEDWLASISRASIADEDSSQE